MIESSALDVLRARIEPTAAKLKEAGHQLYFVGGIVRDLLLGRGDFSDVDLTTDARPKAIKAAVTGSADALWTQGERFGTIGARIGDHAFEITTHRAESYDEASRKPVVSFGDDLVTDLSRRDFTINAMAIDVATGELIDPYNGQVDLKEQRLRTPLDPEISFSDDPLRMLRAARFLPRFGLVATSELVASASALCDRLSIVSGERIHDELAKLLSLPTPKAGLEFLEVTGLLGEIGLASAAPHLGFVADLDTRSARRAGLLMHMSDDAVAGFLEALRFSKVDRRATVRSLAAARSLVDDDVVSAPAIRSAIRSAARSAGNAAMDDVVALLPLAGASLERTASIAAVLAELRASEDLDDRTPPLEGAEIMELLGISAGPAVGEALSHLESLRLERGPIAPDEAKAALRRWASGP